MEIWGFKARSMVEYILEILLIYRKIICTGNTDLSHFNLFKEGSANDNKAHVI